MNKTVEPTEASAKVVTVVPIVRSAFRDELSYYTTQSILPGSVVKIPLRGKTISGLVVSVDDPSVLRSSIKSSPFPLRKISSVSYEIFLRAEFLEACREVASYYACKTGQVIASLVPKVVLDHPKLHSVGNIESSLRKQRENIVPDRRVIQAPDEERYSIYKSLIRENFAKKKSLFFCAPGVIELERLATILSKGVHDYTYILHSGLKKRDVTNIWKRILLEPHPVVVIATPQFLSLPRSDFETVVLENESGNWKQLSRPLIDLRTFAEFFAAKNGSLLVFGDRMLSLETAVRHRAGELQELSPLRQRLLSKAEEVLVDMKVGETDATAKKLVIISPELEELIRVSRESNERLVLLSNRRGLSPTTMCADCGMTVMCTKCLSPLVLHKDASKATVFVCHMCQDVTSTRRRCTFCNSWRLYSFGVGIEQVEQSLHALSPNSTVFVFSSDTIKTREKGSEVMSKFLHSPGAILLGTEMMLPYLTEPVDNSAVVSIDNLFSIPDFNIDERMFRLLTQLKILTRKRFLIQTRHPKHPIFDYVLKGTLLDFFRDELEKRQYLNYPPFATMIKISREGEKNTVVKEMEKLAAMLSNFKPVITPAFTPVVRSSYRMNAILRIEPSKWPHHNLISILRSLPPSFTVDVYPENLL